MLYFVDKNNRKCTRKEYKGNTSILHVEAKAPFFFLIVML